MPGRRLSVFEREEIAVGLAGSESMSSIGRRLGRSPSTVSREVARNANRRGGYRALGAQRKATDRARRPKRCRLADRALKARVRRILVTERHSPDTASRLLARQGVGLSREAIYREIYRGGFGDPRKVLNRPRPHRKQRTRTSRYPTVLGDFKTIHQRPAGFATEPGPWEGDLLVGYDNHTAMVVITERRTRYCILGALPSGRNADHVAEVIIRLLRRIPPQKRRTLTWDQGRELARWKRIEHATGISIYFADARSPWQRPLVENQNAQLRRWFPPGQPITTDQPTLDRAAARLNNIPRRSLQGATAQEAYDQLIGATTV
jgi:IS30 family transposase